ncbi:hypothetical protein DL96DRAFT_1812811 [Flagelloscypha sp. PMI_526]|nr:hypothetical protein DL96DRAFT_1812811 [Flagelloscypha sp. PMI_526]
MNVARIPTSRDDSLIVVPFRDLDHEISCHLEELRRLRARRNEKASWTQQLPTDILNHIFMTYRNEELSFFLPAFSQPTSQKPGPIPWIVPSQVCRHWRTMLLDCAAFWAVLPLSNRKWTKELLLRSKNAPLSVLPPLNSYPQDSLTTADHKKYWTAFRLALRECHRIESLSISLPDLIHTRREEMTLIKTLLRSPFRELRTVRIISSSFVVPTSSSPVGPHAPVDFLTRCHEWLTPQLSSLKISGGSVRELCITLRSNLTRLEVVDEIMSSEMPAIGFLLRLVNQLPGLEHLIIGCALQAVPDGPALDHCVLRHLKSLTINSLNTSLHAIATFLQHLEAQSNLNIAINGSFRPLYPTAPESMENDDGSIVTPRMKALKHTVATLFSALAPFLSSADSQINASSQSATHTFRSLLVEASSWSAKVSLSRTGKLTLQGYPPWDNSTSPWFYFAGFDNSDISIELQDIEPHNDESRYAASTDDNSDDVILKPTSIIFPFTFGLLQSSEHIFLSETQDYRLILSVVPWLNALPSAIHLKELELRVSEQTLHSLVSILGLWKTRIHSKDKGVLPFLESLTFWEYRFRSLSVSSDQSDLPNSLLPSDHSLASNPSSPSLASTPHPTSYILDPLTSLPSTSSAPYRKLIHILTEQQESGCPLRKLSFRLCSNFSERVKREYEKVVQEVIWDGENHSIWEPPTIRGPWTYTPVPEDDSEGSLTDSEEDIN